MNKDIDETDVSFITPGAVFLRENGNKRYVLFLTNTTLSQKNLHKYPSVVVYADEHNNIFSLPTDVFLSICKFHIVEPGLEHRLESLFVFDEEAVQDDDTLNMDFTIAEDESPSIDSNIQEGRELDNPITFSNSQGITEGLVFSPSELGSLVAAYEQEPNLAQGEHYHKITFRTDASSKIESIKKCFDIVGGNNNEPFYDEFTLSDVCFGEEARTVSWTSSIGAFRKYEHGATLLQIILAEKYELTEDTAQQIQISPIIDTTVTTL